MDKTKTKNKNKPAPPPGSDVYFCERCDAFALRISEGTYEAVSGRVHTALSCGHTLTLARPQVHGAGYLQKYSAR